MSSKQQELLIPLSNSDGISLHTIISTTESKPTHPTLLLLHFWGGCNRTYGPLISQLQRQSTIIAPSLRGWGLSSKPEIRDGYHITNYADDIVDLIAYLQNRRPELFDNGLVVVGHSMGGKIAQTLLTKEDIRCVLKGMVLVAPAPATSFALPTEEMREQQRHAYDDLDSARFVIENVLLGRPDAVHAHEVSMLAGDAVAGSEAAKRAWPEYGMSEDYGDEVAEAVRDFSANRNLRTLIIVGSLDRVEPPTRVREHVLQPLEGAGAACTMKEIPNIGHLLPVEAPEVIAEALGGFILENAKR